MKSDFLIALTQLAAERNLPREIVLSAIEAALASAYRKDSITAGQNISVKLDPGSGDVRVYVLKTVVETVEDPQVEITLADARKLDPKAELESTVVTDSFPHTAGRIAAQTAKQVVMQRLREAERELVFQEYENKQGEVFSVNVQRVEPKQAIVDLGRAEAILPASEQVPGERYRAGQKMKVLLKQIVRSAKGPELIVSRADKLILKRMFEMEVPEIYNGAVEIVAIAREPGSRSKVAVRARQDGVDPVGSCVGLRGVRIQNIVNELHGEKIDVMEWHKDPAIFIANALSPSQVMRVELHADDQSATAVVPERQLSLAIGKEGQNARLAAKLTGWRVDIKSNVEYDAQLATRPKPEHETRAVVRPSRPARSGFAQALAEAEAMVSTAEQVETSDEPIVELEAVPVAQLAPVETATEQAEEAAVPQAEPVAAEAAPVSSEAEAPVVEVGATEEQEAPVAEASTDEIIDDIPDIETGEEPAEPVREPVAAADRASIRELGDDVWAVRRSQEPEPGRIRFAEDIAGLRGGVTGSRRTRGREEDNRGAGASSRRHTKAGGKKRR